MNIRKIDQTLYIKVLSEEDIQLREYIANEISQINPQDRVTVERLIQEVLSRVKQDITNMNGEFGVISVNGRNGIVTITPNNIGAEPAFDKRSAFNKNFGAEFNTVCEGNDPRLSDSRTPLAHKHEAIEIDGLEKMIGSNEKIIELQDQAHEHTNKSDLDRVRYTGANETVDLNKLDQLERYLDVDIESVVDHTSREDIHVTTSDKVRWDEKETPNGAQQKATAALDSAKNYTNTVKSELIGDASSSFQTFGRVERALRDLTNDSDSSAASLSSHIQNQSVHITTEERTLIGTIHNKAEATHKHKEFLQCKPFVSIAEMP